MRRGVTDGVKWYGVFAVRADAGGVRGCGVGRGMGGGGALAWCAGTHDVYGGGGGGCESDVRGEVGGGWIGEGAKE